MDLSEIKVIAFDADDTLWVNEPLFRVAEEEFCELMKPFIEEKECASRLFDFEMQNLPLYGYGIKPFTLSLVEAAIALSDHSVDHATLLKIIEIGKKMLNAPVVVLDGVEAVLLALSRRTQKQDDQRKFKLVMATKGDLLDQERKLEKSGLAKYFHHIEVMSDKQPANYQKLVRHLDIDPAHFLMVGNSMKSDILPVLQMGAAAVHIPFHTTWAHEVVDREVRHDRLITIKEIGALTEHL
ncbi:HAD family hydrolase [Croceiramulus getboli]|nr:HAD family hydrolase [Flavobacteriaceae bacterium YJPT1-3]